MKLLKRVLPLFLTAVIIVGGFLGIYGLEQLIPSYKNDIVRSDKRAVSQMLYVEEGETLLVYPWDIYMPGKVVPLSPYLEEYGYSVEDIAYFIDNFVYYQSISGTELEAGFTTTEGALFFEDLTAVTNAATFSQADNIVFIRDLECKAQDGNSYVLNMAFQNYMVLYYHLVLAEREPVSKEDMDRAGMELERLYFDALALYQEYQSNFYEYEGHFAGDATVDGEADDYYDGLLNSWNIFFSKFADQNLLLQFLLELCNASNVDASVFGEKVLLSTYYSFSYEDEILLVFTNDGSGNVTTTDTTIILYYDPVRERFSGFSLKAI